MPPEGPNVDTRHFGGANDLSQGPHQRSVDAHQLLLRNGVRLVQHNPDLVVVRADLVDDVLQFVGNVQFVGIKEQEDQVTAFGKPLAHLKMRFVIWCSGGRSVLKSPSTLTKSYALPSFCLSPAKTPGVSIRVRESRIGEDAQQLT